MQQAAAAAGVAAKLLPEDKELAEAAQKFVARSEQLVTEIAALTKTVDEQTAALPPLTEAFTTARPKVDESLSKVAPLSTTWKQREKSMLAARLKADADAESLAAVNRRLATARRIAKLPELKQAIATAGQFALTRESELAAAEKVLAEFGAVITEREAAVTTATNALTAATGKLDAARAGHARLVGVAEAIAVAAGAAHAAKDKAPEDSTLADAANKLQERADARRVETVESQKRIDAETVAHQTVADALARLSNRLPTPSPSALALRRPSMAPARRWPRRELTSSRNNLPLPRQNQT